MQNKRINYSVLKDVHIVVVSNCGRTHYHYASKRFCLLFLQVGIQFLLLMVTIGCMDGVVSCDWKLSFFFFFFKVGIWYSLLTESCLVICTWSRDIAFTMHKTLSRDWLVAWFCSSYWQHLWMDQASSLWR